MTGDGVHGLLRLASLVVGLSLLAAGLSGCGYKGSLDPPPDAKAEAGAAKQAAKPGDPKPVTPHKPFVLDRLIE
jgi:predicted small lipoprotein YifL